MVHIANANSLADTTRRHPGRVFVNMADVRDCLDAYRIFDVRFSLCDPDYNRKAYEACHIPGASTADVDNDLSGCITKAAGRHPMPDCDAFVQWCMSQGVTPQRPVLCYDDEGGAAAACRLWWLLDNLGVEAYVLNGGLQAYTASGLPLATGADESMWSPAVDWPYATAFSRLYVLDDIPPNAVVVDIRAKCRYESTVRPYGVDRVPGHIKGAINIPFASFFDPATAATAPVLRDEAAIRADMLKVLHTVRPHANRFDECVFQCGSGVTACLAMAVTRQLDLGRPYLYCGSWSQYSYVHQFTLLRHVIQDYGFFCDMMRTKSPCDPKYTRDVHTLLVDERPCASPDDEVAAAASHLHVGEKAKVHFKSGRVVVIEVPEVTAA